MNVLISKIDQLKYLKYITVKAGNPQIHHSLIYSIK